MMVIECDICGFKTPGQPNFCCGCGVDMKEPKEMERENVRSNSLKVAKKGPTFNPEKEEREEGENNVIKWCSISAMCHSYSMTYPLFVSLVLSLAQGKIKLGFCGCGSCYHGYRELLAECVNHKEKKKLTANSREIVKQALKKDLNGVNMDISELLTRPEFVMNDENDQKTTTRIKKNVGKILIELDEAAIENAVLNVLSSEAGRKIIKEISRPRKTMRGVGFEPTDSCETGS